MYKVRACVCRYTKRKLRNSRMILIAPKHWNVTEASFHLFTFSHFFENFQSFRTKVFQFWPVFKDFLAQKTKFRMKLTKVCLGQCLLLVEMDSICQLSKLANVWISKIGKCLYCFMSKRPKLANVWVGLCLIKLANVQLQYVYWRISGWRMSNRRLWWHH